jgi:hypothetical protein
MIRFHSSQGGLGLTSTHCVTHARLIIDGKDFGVCTFIVQLRSLDDHKPLPGYRPLLLLLAPCGSG